MCDICRVSNWRRRRRQTMIGAHSSTPPPVEDKLKGRVNYAAGTRLHGLPPQLLIANEDDFITPRFVGDGSFPSAAFPPAFPVHAALSSPDSPSRQPGSTEFSLRDFDKSLCMQAESLTHFLMNEYCKWAERLCVLGIPPLFTASPQHP